MYQAVVLGQGFKHRVSRAGAPQPFAIGGPGASAAALATDSEQCCGSCAVQGRVTSVAVTVEVSGCTVLPGPPGGRSASCSTHV